MRSDEIRSRFLRHFEVNGHTVVPSASLLADDPTLLLVNAGMVPFKPYFLGEQPAPYQRAASVQKCVRTVDIDNVGKTARHASFFQMAGNFSFGDYFKAGAISLAWQLLTASESDGGYGFPEDKLWATVYLDDDEAYTIWRDDVGVPEERIQRRGKADNFWSMGVPGPCGPCSEIYYDRGPEFGKDGGPEADEDRYLEVWNLVFMQFERGAGAGKEDFPILGDLPAKNIDTGMGIERMATILQRRDNLYEIDQVLPILHHAEELTGTPYGYEHDVDVALRVIADHTRTAIMLIADGVIPSNEGRGYVLRRMLRRAVRNAVKLHEGQRVPVMGELTAVVRDVMGGSYPELVSDFDRISSYAVAEESAFLDTLGKGVTILDVAVKETKQAGGAVLRGEDAFKLHDTYGFPIDLTLEMAAEQGLSVDEDGFRRLMAEQRARGKADRAGQHVGHADVSAYRELRATSGATTFTGYDEVARESVVRGLLKGAESISAAHEGEEVEVVLDATPFYAEGGGQQADLGLLRLRGSVMDAVIEVLDVQRVMPDLVVHRVKVRSGEVTVGDAVEAAVDVERRRAISRAHTATHLVHRAFRGALGEAATQAGSLNAPGRLRFDFASPHAVPPSVLNDVEDEVNEILLGDLEVRAFVTSQAHAREIGAMALFGEKYGDEVRVVEVGDYARELCGGTHAGRSGQLGMVKLLSEASIGSGVRRVEALVGLDAFRFLAREHVLVSGLAEMFKVPADEVPDRVNGLVGRLRDAEKELEGLKGAAVLSAAAGIASGVRDVAGVAVATHVAPSGTSTDDSRKLALDVRGRIDPSRPALVAVFAETDGRASVVVAVNPAAQERGLKAGAVVRSLSSALGGGGGGKDDVAQGGGPNGSAVADAVRLVDDLAAGGS